MDARHRSPRTFLPRAYPRYAHGRQREDPQPHLRSSSPGFPNLAHYCATGTGRPPSRSRPLNARARAGPPRRLSSVGFSLRLRWLGAQRSIEWLRRAHVLFVRHSVWKARPRERQPNERSAFRVQTIARRPFPGVSADSKSERNLQRRSSFLIQTHSRIHVQFAHSNRVPSATSGDVHNPVLHARKRYRLNFLPASQNQRELALVRQRFGLLQGKALVVRFQLRLLLRLLRRPLLARALLLILPLILSRLRISIRIQVRPRRGRQHIRPPPIRKNEP